MKLHLVTRSSALALIVAQSVFSSNPEEPASTGLRTSTVTSSKPELSLYGAVSNMKDHINGLLRGGAPEAGVATNAGTTPTLSPTHLYCDWETDETCYDKDWTVTSCAKISSGGCPCSEGEEKCGAFDGYAGRCEKVCCDWETDETCYDKDWTVTSCAKLSDGGCPCSEGKEKCGAFDGHPGWCQLAAKVCCDRETEEECFDENYKSSCAKLSDGGCPCSEGEEKCGAHKFFAGWCQSANEVCCDSETEEWCYDDVFTMSCAKISDGCPRQTSFVHKQNKMFGITFKHGTRKEIASLNLLKEKLNRASGEAAKYSLKHNMVTLVRSVESRRAHIEKKKTLSSAVVSFV